MRALPLALTGVQFNMLDGSVEGDITVPTRTKERQAARRMAMRQPLSRVLLTTSYLAIAAAFLMWITS